MSGSQEKNIIPLDNWFILKDKGLENLLYFEDYFNNRDFRYVLYNDKLYNATELNVIRQLKLHGINPNFEVDYVSQFYRYVQNNEIWNKILDIDDLPITILGNLKEIKGGLWLESNKILDIYDLSITTLGNLKKVERGLWLYNNKTLKSLGKLEKVGDCLDLENSELNDLGELKHIDLHIWLKNSKLDNIGKLEYVGGSWLSDTKNLESLYEQRINTLR